MDAQIPTACVLVFVKFINYIFLSFFKWFLTFTFPSWHFKYICCKWKGWWQNTSEVLPVILTLNYKSFSGRMSWLLLYFNQGWLTESFWTWWWAIVGDNLSVCACTRLNPQLNIIEKNMWFDILRDCVCHMHHLTLWTSNNGTLQNPQNKTGRGIWNKLSIYSNNSASFLVLYNTQLNINYVKKENCFYMKELILKLKSK